jgi:AcrR family transcriptional regulator
MATVKCVGHKYSLEEMVAAAVKVTLRDGVARLTFLSVAEELGTSDRMVVYYFPAKEDLVMATVAALSSRMQSLLEQAFGNDRRSPDELIERAWPTLKKKSADRVFQVLLELVGLSVSGIEPYRRITRNILSEWADWLGGRVDAPTRLERRRLALGVIARVDGLLILRHGLGPAAADEAARALRAGRR